MRILQIIVVVLGIILIVGMATVIGRIAYLMMRPASEVATSAPYSQPEIPIDLALPGNTKVTSTSLDGSQLAVHYTGPEGTGIAIVDLKSGDIIRRIRVLEKYSDDKNDSAKGSGTIDRSATDPPNELIAGDRAPPN